MSEKHPNRESAAKQYLAQRYYFGQLCHSAPLFFVLGKERGYNIVEKIVYPAKSTQLTSEVQRLKASGADLIMQSSYLGDAILAKDRLAAYYKKGAAFEVLEEVPGAALAGLTYEPLFPYFAALKAKPTSVMDKPKVAASGAWKCRTSLTVSAFSPSSAAPRR